MFSQATIKRSGVQALPSAFFLAQETLLHLVSVHPSVYMGTGDILLEGNLRWTSIRSRGAAILLGLLHVKESGISSGRLSLWLLCAFFSLFFCTSFE